MRVLFVTPNSGYPKLRAGTEVTTHFQCLRLIEAGHQAAVAATGNPSPISDELNGYPVFRANDLRTSVPAAVQAFDPDTIVLLEPSSWVNELVGAIGDRGIVFYQHSVHAGIASISPALTARAKVLATSADCARRLLLSCQLQSLVVPPVFGIDRFAGPPSRGQQVLFASLQNRKGADLVIRMAQARPQVQFQILETWTGSESQTTALRAEIAELPNMACHGSQADLVPFFNRTRLLLMPSRSQEGWGRMASEVQTRGIPVLASSRGNLPQTVGKGGACLDPDAPFDQWLALFDRIMTDDAFHNRLSVAALENAASLRLRAEAVFKDFEQALLEASSKPRSAVHLVRKPVAAKARAPIVLADVWTFLRLASARAQIALVAEKNWPLLTRVSAAIGAVAGWKSFAATESHIAAALDVPARTAKLISNSLRAARHEIALQCVKGSATGGWRPDIIAVNFKPLTEALAAGRGCVLWTPHFVFAPNVVKMALHQAGFACAHISRPDHGFSSTEFGLKHLNPIRTRFEDKFLRERIVFDRARPLPAMRRARRILADNGVLSITAGAWEGGHIAQTAFLGRRLSLSAGPMAIARANNATLLPVFGLRTHTANEFAVTIGAPISVSSQASHDEAMRAGMAAFASQLTPWVRAYPDQWRGWSALQPL